jgi:hypothetical protein
MTKPEVMLRIQASNRRITVELRAGKATTMLEFVDDQELVTRVRVKNPARRLPNRIITADTASSPSGFAGQKTPTKPTPRASISSICFEVCGMKSIVESQ